VGHKREFVYWFNLEEESEIELDLSRLLPIPKRGEFLFRRKKEWKVVNVTFDVIAAEETLVVNVYLSDKYLVS
jgi:hypothetical protein